MNNAVPVSSYDRWLDDWRDLIQASVRSALDVGCGPGFDTEALRSWGITVTAIDVSAEALARSQVRNPKVPHALLDVRSIASLGEENRDLVVASLSLHYFSREETHAVFRSIWRILRDGGLFAFRVNAWDDRHFGAPEMFVEWQLVSHQGAQKQFFTEAMIRELVDGRYTILDQAKTVTHRYGHAKSCFRLLCRKDAPREPSNEGAITPSP